ncbi:hypothetical protein PtA15_5A673 [Puccinia triticina]|uniref:Uncharacterized protein n=1 Tax=Puccinia triticina TaxID=208348 RepID=A0ABY7CJ07_9BASI|nr:uncharacterized protein PtA15_5A673 [Puccinia triticina]WAQ85099.1 hypothetical protein PtA15_5A673 [Puccinia triticina]WAR58433.1 hypothetical protein PtB15_5B667 [Puccinia triticina]
MTSTITKLPNDRHLLTGTITNITIADPRNCFQGTLVACIQSIIPKNLFRGMYRFGTARSSGAACKFCDSVRVTDCHLSPLIVTPFSNKRSTTAHCEAREQVLITISEVCCFASCPS